MADSKLTATFGGSVQGMTHMRDLMGRYARFDATMRAETVIKIRELAIEMRDETKRQFEPHNRSGYSISTIKLESSGGTWAKISMGGGAPYVETGTPPHVIASKLGGPTLHFVSGGNDVFTRRVNHPGYKGDPFVERAFNRLDIATQLAGIFESTLNRVFPKGAFTTSGMYISTSAEIVR